MSLWTPSGFRQQSKKQQQEQLEASQKKAQERQDEMSRIVDKFLDLLAKEGFKMSDVNYLISILQNKLGQIISEKTLKEVLKKKDAESIQ